jgi:hypothetical protein
MRARLATLDLAATLDGCRIPPGGHRRTGWCLKVDTGLEAAANAVIEHLLAVAAPPETIVEIETDQATVSFALGDLSSGLRS